MWRLRQSGRTDAWKWQIAGGGKHPNRQALQVHDCFRAVISTSEYHACSSKFSIAKLNSEFDITVPNRPFGISFLLMIHSRHDSPPGRYKERVRRQKVNSY